jgi:hypothetical protein
MTLITVDTYLTEEEVQRAITFLLKERERTKLQGQRRRARQRENKPPVVKEKKEPKKYYQPTGKPRGRPRKNTPVVEPPSEIPPA